MSPLRGRCLMRLLRLHQNIHAAMPQRDKKSAQFSRVLCAIGEDRHDVIGGQVSLNASFFLQKVER